MHALIENGGVKQYPYNPARLRAEYPNTSFPVSMSDESLKDYGVHRVYTSTPPQHDTATQVLEEAAPVFDLASERWMQTWRVRDFTEEEIAWRTDGKAAEVRAERNRLIAESDWTQLPDSPADKAAWATYRQALRDLTNQVGFPWDVIWPEVK